MIIDFLEIASFNSQRSFQLIWWIMVTFLSNCKKVGIYLWGEKVCLVEANCQRVVKWAVGTMSKVESEPHTLNISFHLSVSTAFLNKSFDFFFVCHFLWSPLDSRVLFTVPSYWCDFFFFFHLLLIKFIVKFIVDECERME